VPFELSPLPYAKNALAPHISEETVDFHYGKHHGGYVTKLNAAVAGTPDESKSLEALVRTSGSGVFNLAAQIWNHDFYWQSLTPGGGGEPGGALASALAGTFGSVAKFNASFAALTNGHFGSGWAWLSVNAFGTLELSSTSDADTPLRLGATPLLTIDVWEHAYYIDKRNDRPGYTEAVMSNLLNWRGAEERYDAAMKALG
jgi:Fe-Mn family superoxide dismutase